MKTAYFFPVMLLVVLGLGGCQKSHTPEQQISIDKILKQRIEKDSLFRNAPWTPIREEDRTGFPGLSYFPIDLELRFRGPIITYDSLVPDTITGTRGDRRPARKFGYFSFHYKDGDYRLEIYEILRDDPDADSYLFLGFTDKTTGKETYGTGRYIDLLEMEDGFYAVDFNRAYNPYCAYNPRYSCAIPKDENRLPFAVRAGEKIFHK